MSLFIYDRRCIIKEDQDRWLLEVELLTALCQDLVEWIHKILPDEKVSLNTFFSDLRDGVILCRLANKLHDFRMAVAKDTTNLKKNWPDQIKIYSHSSCQTDQSMFKSRNNVTLFLQWCRENNVNESVLFETNDCVDEARSGRREIIICLWSLARMFKSFNAPLPNLITYEIENNQSEKSLLETYLKYKDEVKRKAESESTSESKTTESHLFECSSVQEGELEDSSANATNDVCNSGVLSNESESAEASRYKTCCTKPTLVRHELFRSVNKTISREDLRLPTHNAWSGKIKFHDKSYLINQTKGKIHVRTGGGWIEIREFLERKYSTYIKIGVDVLNMKFDIITKDIDSESLSIITNIVNEEKKQILRSLNVLE